MGAPSPNYKTEPHNFSPKSKKDKKALRTALLTTLKVFLKKILRNTLYKTSSNSHLD